MRRELGAGGPENRARPRAGRGEHGAAEIVTQEVTISLKSAMPEKPSRMCLIIPSLALRN
jgi:hypothetical protein